MRTLACLLFLALIGCERAHPPTSELHCPEILAAVFADLPADVPVLPTEHYFYWQRTVNGQPLHGNLRFANGLRERGILSFGYAGNGFADSQHFTAADGVELTCPDDFTVNMRFHGKTVQFHLHQLPQIPPPFTLKPDERFVERTCDESERQFYLIHQRTGNFFLWMLDPATPGKLRSLQPAILLDEPTGFVFWQQEDRLILAGVAAASIRANTPYDGPFDQLADNYALTSGRQALLEQAVPECAGRIDAWGNYLDSPKPRRVALVPYCQYESLDEATAFVTAAIASSQPLAYISRVGK